MNKIFFCLTLFIPWAAWAQDISIESYLERDSALIGEQFMYSISVKSDIPLHSVVPLSDNLFPAGIEVLSEDADSVLYEGYREYQNKYLVTCFDSGVYLVNSIPVLVNTYQDLDTLFTPEIEMIIYSPQVDTAAAIKDIKEPLNTPFSFEELIPYLPYAGGILLIILTALLIYFYAAGKRKKEEEIIQHLPAHIKALEALDRIKREKLWQKGQVKEYYSMLSDTVRIYIEDRYNIPAMESVTWEILDSFRKYSWDDESLMDILQSLLQLSDLVKFAKEDPSPSENEINLNNAYIFIEKTRPADKLEEVPVNKA